MDTTRTSVLGTCERPVSSHELAAAGSLLGTAHPLALAALALPAGELPGACWTRTATAVCYRGASLDVTRAQDPDMVAAWARSFWSDRDRSLPPAGPVHHWVRSVRSGASRQVWGPGDLWTGPTLRTGPEVDVDAVVELLGRWWAGEMVAPPALVDTGDGVLLLDGDDDSWSLTADAVPVPVPGPAPVPSDLAASLAAEVDGLDWSLEPTGPGTWVCRLRLDGWTALVDLRVHQLSAVVGRIARLPGPRPRTSALPLGWTAESSAGAVVAAVHRSGLRAVLHPDTSR